MSIFPWCSGLLQVFHGFRNLVPNLHVLPFFSYDAGRRKHEGAGALQNSSADTVRGALLALPPSPPLEIHNSNAAENWKQFEQAWKNYSIAMKLHQKPEAVHTGSNIACRNRS